MNDKILNLGIAVINFLIERAKTNSKIAAKIQNGEPLTIEDFKSLGDDRDAAGDILDQAIDDA